MTQNTGRTLRARQTSAGGLDVNAVPIANINGRLDYSWLAGSGSANRVPGINAAGTDLEYKSVVGGNNVVVVHSPGTITIAVSAGFKGSIVTKSASYLATTDDWTILCNATSGAMTISLPAAASVVGQVYNIKKIDSSGNIVTVDPNGSELIDGSATHTGLNALNKAITIQSDGTAWYII